MAMDNFQYYDRWYTVPDGYKGWKEFVNKTKADRKFLIDDEKKALHTFRHRLLKKQGKQFSVTTLMVDKDGFVSPLVTAMPSSREIPILEDKGLIAPATVLADMTGRMMSIERYFYGYLNFKVKADCNGNIPGVGTIDGSPIYRYVLFFKNGQTAYEGFYVKGPEKMENLLTKRKVKFSHFFDKNGKVRRDIPLRGGLHAHVYVYGDKRVGSDTSTNGQQKNGEITLSCSTMRGFRPYAHANLLTYGALRGLRRVWKGRKPSMKKLAQASTRVAQFKAPSVALGHVNGIAVHMYKWVDADGNEWRDGMDSVAAEAVAEALTSVDPKRFVVTPWAIDGATIQQRPFNMKGNDKVVPRRCIVSDLKREGCLDPDKFVVLYRDELRGEARKEAQNLLDQAVIDGEGEWAGKTVYIFDSRYDGGKEVPFMELVERHLDLSCDLNGLKTTFQVWKSSTFNILDICHWSGNAEGEANSSNQLLQTPLFSDKAATAKVMDRMFKKEFENTFCSMLESEPRKVSRKEVLAGGDLSQLVVGLNPRFVTEIWAPYFQDGCQKRLDGIVHRLEKLAVSTDGVYLKIVPDVGHGYRGRLSDLLRYYPETGACEIYAPMMDKEGKSRAIGIKYPKVGWDEFGKFQAVHRDEMLRRAWELVLDGVIDMDEYRDLEHQIKTLSRGVVMVPAIETLKDMLAGLDFDGDALILYTDDEIVEICWALNPSVTKILADDEYEQYIKEHAESTE